MEQEYKYMVHTLCWTYNHNRYIIDALNGFAIQQTSFPIVSVIIDDASDDGEQDTICRWTSDNLDFKVGDATDCMTDNAHVICAPLKKNRNHTFYFLLLYENHHSINKSKRSYFDELANSSKYVALCEGDDYWIDPLKLQKQVDFLEKNPEYGMCYTYAYLEVSGRVKPSVLLGSPFSSIKELIIDNRIPTMTVLLRYDLDKQYREVINPGSRRWKMGDYPEWLWFAAESSIYFLQDVTAIYRQLPESASHSKDLERMLSFADSAYDIKLFFDERYGIGCKRMLMRQGYSHKMARISAYGLFRRTLSIFIAAIKDDKKSLFHLKNYYYLARALFKSKK